MYRFSGSTEMLGAQRFQCSSVFKELHYRAWTDAGITPILYKLLAFAPVQNLIHLNHSR